MSNRKRALWMGAALMLMAAVGLRFTLAKDEVPGWLNKGDNWPAQKQQLQAYGERFKTSWEMYQALKQAAGEARNPGWAQMG